MTKFTKGKVVEATVTGIEPYGIFVSLDEYYSGLIHISEISHNFVRDVHDYVKIGDVIYTEIIDIDEQSFHLSLSIKNIKYKKDAIPRKKKIIETPLGFKTLAYKLPIWIEESLQKIEKTSK